MAIAKCFVVGSDVVIAMSKVIVKHGIVIEMKIPIAITQLTFVVEEKDEVHARVPPIGEGAGGEKTSSVVLKGNDVSDRNMSNNGILSPILEPGEKGPCDLPTTKLKDGDKPHTSVIDSKTDGCVFSNGSNGPVGVQVNGLKHTETRKLDDSANRLR